MTNNQLDEIRKLIIKHYYQKRHVMDMDSDSYKCEHWVDYENNYHKAVDKLRAIEDEIISKINNYLNYPVRRILFWNTCKSVKIYKKIDYYLVIPFVDNREYYCLITMLKKLLKFSYDDEYNLNYLYDDII